MCAHGRVQGVHDGGGDVVREVLGPQSSVGGRAPRGLAPRLLPRRVAVHGHPGIGQGVQSAGQERVGDAPVHEERLGGVADAGALRLGVDEDVDGHVEVGRCVHVHMAVAGARLDDRDGGLLDDGT